MGSQSEAICSKCGNRFTVSSGGGFFFHQLRCEACGQDKSISFKEIGDPHRAFLKGLKGPYCTASTEHDEYVRQTYQGKALSVEQYHEEVEALVGKCSCGGQFRFNARPRCPHCKSSLPSKPDCRLITEAKCLCIASSDRFSLRRVRGSSLSAKYLWASS